MRHFTIKGWFTVGRYSWTSRHTVEQCQVLDSTLCMRYAPGHPVCIMTIGTEPKYSIGYYRLSDADVHTMHLLYCLGSGPTLDHPVPMQTTTPYFGGRRWWFTCPSCRRRAKKLYLPPGSWYFRCRTCHNLTYEACRESHTFDSLYKSIGLNAMSMTQFRRLLGMR